MSGLSNGTLTTQLAFHLRQDFVPGQGGPGSRMHRQRQLLSTWLAGLKGRRLLAGDQVAN